VKFASKSSDMASLLVNGLLVIRGFILTYTLHHVILGIYTAAVAKCSQV